MEYTGLINILYRCCEIGESKCLEKTFRPSMAKGLVA